MRPLKSGSNGSIYNEWSRVFDFGREGNAVVVQNNKKSSQINFRIWDNKEKLHGVRSQGCCACQYLASPRGGVWHRGNANLCGWHVSRR